MKISSIEKITSFIIIIDDCPCDYLRIGPDSYEKSYGESWETVFCEREVKQLEALFQKFLKVNSLTQ